MRSRLILVLAALAAVLLIKPQTADPCGVKLNIKAPRVKKQSDRSSNPSQILLLGDPPRALSKELTGRGHKVEVAGSADEARRVKYHAIVADPDREDEAKTRWPGALVVVRRGNAKADANLVDQQLGSSPTRTMVARTPLRTSRDDRTPIRTGPERQDGRGAPVAAGGGAGGERSLEATGGGSADTAAPAPAPADEEADEPAAPPAKRTAAVSADVKASADVEREPAEDSVKVPARFSKRIFFGNSAAQLSSRARAKLVRNAKWLERHSNVSVVIEGHASTTGAAEPNQALSEARANAVKAYLVEQGIDDSRLEAKGYGMTRPEFKPGYSGKNRRVVLKVGK